MCKLYIDSREPREIKEELTTLFNEDNIECEIIELQQGDYKYGKILIERKEISDLNSSLNDGRIKNQTYRMLQEKQEQGIHPYIVIQGSYKQLVAKSRRYHHYCMTQKQLLGLIASLNEKGINTIQLEGKGVKEFYNLLRALILHENNERTEVKEVLLKPKISDYNTRCYYMIEGLGEEKARQLARKAPITSMIQLPENILELYKSIDGIGDKTANKIINKLKGE